MATLLRSIKHIRSISACRNTLFLRGGKTVNHGSEVHANAFFASRSKNYATFYAPKINKAKAASDIDQSLKKLDQDIRLNVQIPISDIKHLLKVFETGGKASSAQALFLIRCCGESIAVESPKEREKIIADVWNSFRALNVNLDVSHYNALLEAYLQVDYNFSPLDFLIQMKNDGIEPNRVTYQRLVMRYCNKGDIEGATKILEYMSKNDLPINENIFSCLIRGHAESGDTASAVNMLDVMKDAGIEPKIATYAALMNAYAVEGNMDKIKTTLTECEENDIAVTDYEMLSVLYTLAAKGHIQHIDEILCGMARGMFYNRCAIQTIYKLIDINQIDVAYKLLTSLVPNTKGSGPKNTGVFFIRKLVNNEVPFETIYNLCQTMETEGIHDNARKIALEMSIRKGAVWSLDMMTLWKRDGGEIREHFFYPVLLTYGRVQGNYEGVLKTLGAMVNDFKIIPRIDTLREYFMPYSGENFNEISSTLMQLKIPMMTIKHSILLYYILLNKLGKVFKYISKTPGPYMTKIIGPPITSAFAVSGDAESFVNILHYIYNDMSEKLENDLKLEAEHATPDEFLNATLMHMVQCSSLERTPQIIEVVNKLVEKGMSITTETADKIRAKIKNDLTPEISQNLEKLTSGELAVAPIKAKKTYWVKIVQDVNQVERLIAERLRENKPVDTLQKKLLTIYCNNMDEAKITKLISDLQKENFQFTESMCAKFIDIYSVLGKMEQAEFWMNEFYKQNPNGKLDRAKILKYATLLINNGRIDDALNALNMECQDKDVERPILASSLLERVAEMNDKEMLNKFSKSLKEKGFVTKINNFLLSSLIKVHLDKGDVAEAINKFEAVSKQYSLAPMKMELMKVLIKEENSKELQRVTDIVTSVYGEPDSLITLAMAFFECGRYQQAKKILQTPGLYVFKDKLTYYAQKYIEQRDMETLERFSELFKTINSDITIKLIAPQLLSLYREKNNWEKGLALWTQMQEDNIQPSTEFMNNLANLLVSNNIKVPFTYTDGAAIQLDGAFDSQFKNTILGKNYDKAKALLENSKDKVGTYSELAEAFIKDKRYRDALSLGLQLHQKHNAFFHWSVVKRILYGLADTNDAAGIEEYGQILNDAAKETLVYKRFLTRSYLKSGKWDVYLDKLEENLYSPNVAPSNANIHHATLVEAYEKYPEHRERFDKIAKEYAARDIVGPMGVIWTHHFVHNNLEEANKIWSEYLENAKLFFGHTLLDIWKKTKDEDLLTRTAESLCKTQLSRQTKVAIYNHMVTTVLSSEHPNKSDILYNCLTIAVNDVTMSRLNRKLLKEAELVLSQTGKSLFTDKPTESLQEAASG